MPARQEAPRAEYTWNNVSNRPDDPHFILVDILAREGLVTLGRAFDYKDSKIPGSRGVILKDPSARGVLERVTQNEDFVTLYFATHGRNITPELMIERVTGSEFFDPETKRVLIGQYWMSRLNHPDAQDTPDFAPKMREHIERIVEKEKDPQKS